MFLSVVYSHSLLVITWSYGIVSKPQMFTKTIMYSSAAFPNVNIAAQLTGDPIHLYTGYSTVQSGYSTVQFKTSNRKTTQMVTPTPDIQYAYNASITWNWARQVIKSNTDISDFSFSSADAKAILKNHILMSQKMGNPCEWNKYRDKLVLF